MRNKRSILLLLLVLGSFASAQEKPEAKKDDKQVVDTKAQKRTPATAIDFRKELTLPYPSLATLGTRIEQARRAPDPVSLGHAANELAIAEKVSGKKASVTSPELLKEAAELAKLRRQVTELQALAQLNGQIANEEKVATDLKLHIEKAKEFAKQEKAIGAATEQPAGGPRKVLVNNYTTQYADIFVNGYYKLEVPPGESRWFVIEHKWNPTVLKASGNNDDTYWGPRYLWGNWQTYTWNLN